MIQYAQIHKKVAKFEAFLSANGAQVLHPTNQWEVVRFIAGGETSIVYTNKRGDLSFIGHALGAWEAFRHGKPWRVDPKNKAALRSTPMIVTIRARDGDDCFFCALPVAMEDESAEHLVPRAHGGPNHVSNLFLAHRECNIRAGHLSAPEKIKIHVNSRRQHGPTDGSAGAGVAHEAGALDEGGRDAGARGDAHLASVGGRH